MIEYKRIKGLPRIFLMGCFHRVQGAHEAVCNMLISSRIKDCRVASSPTMRQWLSQGLNTNPITDPSLKSIKGRTYPKIMTMKLLQVNKNNFVAKLCWNHRMIDLSFHCLFFAKKSYHVFENYCLSTHWVLLNTCIHSNYCLWKPWVAYC